MLCPGIQDSLCQTTNSALLKVVRVRPRKRVIDNSDRIAIPAFQPPAYCLERRNATLPAQPSQKVRQACGKEDGAACDLASAAARIRNNVGWCGYASGDDAILAWSLRAGNHAGNLSARNSSRATTGSGKYRAAGIWTQLDSSCGD